MKILRTVAMASFALLDIAIVAYWVLFIVAGVLGVDSPDWLINLFPMLRRIMNSYAE